MSLFLEFLSTLLISTSEVICWFNISKKENNLKSVKSILLIILLTVLNIVSYHYTNHFIKSVSILLIAIFLCKLIMNENIKRCLILTFLCELIVIIVETFLVMIAYSIFKTNITDSGDIYIAAIFDLFVSIFIILFSHLKFLNKIYLYLDKITILIKGTTLLWLIMFIMFGTSAIFTSLYLKENVILVLTINIFILLLYTIIVILVFRYHDKYYKITLKYNNSLNNLQAQDAIINDYRVMNHENKNQLLTIKSMVKNKKVEGYINSLINQKNIFNNEILSSSLKIPEGGIRGLIYSKMLLMKENDIKCNLNVDKNLKRKTLLTIDDTDTVDICQILGVFIDNAIDETKNLRNKIINIDLHIMENKLVISVINEYINELMYVQNGNYLKTTKGKNHGYGLQLVRKITNQNSKITYETIITKDIFTQKLYINLV